MKMSEKTAIQPGNFRYYRDERRARDEDATAAEGGVPQEQGPAARTSGKLN